MIKQCIVCGTDFDARNSRQINCSPKCSKERKRQYSAQWRADPEGREWYRQYNAQRNTDPEYKKRKRQYNTQYRANPNNRERQRQYAAQWYADPEHRGQVHQRYTQRNADPKVKQRQRQYAAQRRADPEYRERQRQYAAQRNADPKIKEFRRQYYAQRQTDPEYRERKHQYHVQRYSDPEVRERMRINGHNRQARKRSLSNTFTPTQWQQALDYFNGCCAVCGNQLKDLFGEVTVHADHWIPLTSSECPGTIATNMICLCNKCNLSKHNTMPVVWLRRRYSERKARQIEKRIAEYFEWLRKR